MNHWGNSCTTNKANTEREHVFRLRSLLMSAANNERRFTLSIDETIMRNAYASEVEERLDRFLTLFVSILQKRIVYEPES